MGIGAKCLWGPLGGNGKVGRTYSFDEKLEYWKIRSDIS